MLQSAKRGASSLHRTLVRAPITHTHTHTGTHKHTHTQKKLLSQSAVGGVTPPSPRRLMVTDHLLADSDLCQQPTVGLYIVPRCRDERTMNSTSLMVVEDDR